MRSLNMKNGMVVDTPTLVSKVLLMPWSQTRAFHLKPTYYNFSRQIEIICFKILLFAELSQKVGKYNFPRPIKKTLV